MAVHGCIIAIATHSRAKIRTYSRQLAVRFFYENYMRFSSLYTLNGIVRDTCRFVTPKYDELNNKLVNDSHKKYISKKIL